MTDRDLLELIATQVTKLTKQVTKLTIDVDTIKATMATQKELAEVKAIVVRIENDHGQKLGALLNGYGLLSDRLDRVERQVAKHEKILFREHD